MHMTRLLTAEKQRGKEDQRETKGVLDSIKGWKWLRLKRATFFSHSEVLKCHEGSHVNIAVALSAQLDPGRVTRMKFIRQPCGVACLRHPLP